MKAFKTKTLLTFLFLIPFSFEITSASSDDNHDVKRLLHCDENLDESEENPPSRKKTKVTSHEKEALKVVTINKQLEVSTFENYDLSVIEEINGTVIVTWDIDRTLLRTLFFLRNLHPVDQEYYLNRYFDNELFTGSEEDKASFMLFNYEEIKSYHEGRKVEEVLVEECLLSVIQKIETMGALQLGLTARKLFFADPTKKSLGKYGIDFAKLSKLNQHTVEELNLIQGCIYTQNNRKKAHHIPELVDHIVNDLKLQGPITIIHIDDSEDEMFAFSQARKIYSKHDLTIQPVYYTHFNMLMGPILETEIGLIQEIHEQIYNKRFKTQESKE